MKCLFAVVFCAAISGGLFAAELIVTFELQGAIDAEAQLLLTVSSNDGGDVRKFELAASSSQEIVVPERSTWVLGAQLAGSWVPERAVSIGEGSGKTEIVLDVYPTLPVDFQSSTAGDYEIEFADQDSQVRGRVQCVTEDAEKYICAVPVRATMLAIRLPGYVPVYRWLSAPLGAALDLGGIVLTKGASVSGNIKPENGSMEGCRVELHDNQAPSRPDSEVQRPPVLSSPPDDNGWFQFSGLAIGHYEVKAHCGHLSGSYFPVPTVEGKETRIRDPILVQSPVLAEIIVTPPVDLKQRSWNLAVDRMGKYSVGSEHLGEFRTSPTGAATFFTRSGSHTISVTDSSGNRWKYMDNIDIRSGAPIYADISFVQVTGKVTAGKDPVRAEVVFGGRHGPQSVVAQSDEHGEFEVHLPRPGTWNVEVVRQDQGLRVRREVEIERTNTKLTLDLPNTGIEGRVLDSKGRPAGNAIVSIARTSKKGIDAFEVRADDEGRFLVKGVDPGTVYAEARQQHLRSAKQLVVVQEKVSAKGIVLQLLPTKQVRGRLVSGGHPVPGGLVALVSRSTPKETTANGFGEFELAVPEDWAMVTVIAGGAGVSLTSRVVSLTEGEMLIVDLPRFTGTLHAEFGTPGQQEKSGQVPFLFQDGVLLPTSLVAKWMGLHGITNGKSIPYLSPGVYRLCLTDLSTLPRFLATQQPTGQCSEGFLGAGQEIVLTAAPG